jgi:hypothetical protein
VLDFVGQHRADFRFDRLLSGITGLTRTELIDAVEHGFSTLPPGCHIHLHHQTRQQVLRSLRLLVNQTWSRLKAEVQSYATLRGTRNVRLGQFLHDQRIALSEIYRDARPSGWTTLKRDAGLLPGNPSDDEGALSRRLGDLLHVDDPSQLAVMRRVAEARAEYVAESASERVRAQMLAYQIDSGRQPLPYKSHLQRFAISPAYAYAEEPSTGRRRIQPGLTRTPGDATSRARRTGGASSSSCACGSPIRTVRAARFALRPPTT